MQKFVEKMVKDKKELDEKIAKLNTFLATDTYNTLSQKEKKLRKDQFAAMSEYSRILKEIIAIYL